MKTIIYRIQLALFITFLLPATLYASETLNWVGCGITKKAFMSSLAEAYEQKTGVHIEILGGGATKGIRDVAAKKADIGGSCRYKIEGAPQEHAAVLDPVAWDALVIIVHKDNPVNNITLKQIHGIYTNRINNWKELGGNDQPIQLYAREGKISGVGMALRKIVFANYEQEFLADNFFPSSGPLEKAIEQNPNSLGATGISSARKRDVKILKLEGKEPSVENIQKGTYMLYRPLYLIYNPGSQRSTEVRKFIKFAHSAEGRDIIRKNEVVPYRDALGLVMKELEQEQRARELGLYD
jgi:phosphate transport system substrate-binding protein